MQRAVDFLKNAEVYYLATVDGDQPRVRPFGTAHVFEGKLYIQTGKVKDVSKQIHANPKVEAYPSLQGMYSADDGNTEVFYFKNATATFSSFTAAPETIRF